MLTGPYARTFSKDFESGVRRHIVFAGQLGVDRGINFAQLDSRFVVPQASGRLLVLGIEMLAMAAPPVCRVKQTPGLSAGAGGAQSTAGEENLRKADNIMEKKRIASQCDVRREKIDQHEVFLGNNVGEILLIQHKDPVSWRLPAGVRLGPGLWQSKMNRTYDSK